MNSIYLDNAATTAPEKSVLENALKVCGETYYNPSAQYLGGRLANEVISSSREKLEKIFFGKKVFFTSCGTEADNTAVFSYGTRGNIVTTLGEHSAVYKCFEYLKQKGIEVRFAKTDYGGGVNEEDLLSKIDEKTTFVSVVHVNNETGAINDIDSLSQKVKRINPKVVFHSDGVQAFGKVKADISNVDLYSVSAHKIGGLKGTGCLYYGSKLHVHPLILGGGQENGLRSGTENVLGIKVFADCAAMRYANIEENYDKCVKLKSALFEGLDKRLFKTISPENCSPYICCFSAVGLKGQVVQSIMDQEGVIVGKGSACSSKNPFSRIVSSFESDKRVLDGVVRISFSPYTTFEEVENCVKILNIKVLELSDKVKK